MLRSRGLGRLGWLAVGLGIAAALASTPGDASGDSAAAFGDNLFAEAVIAPFVVDIVP
jgi:hypothetical protein